MVTDGVYRSGQPNRKQLAYLVDHYGIKSVIKLNTGDEPQNCPLVKAPSIPAWSVVSSGSSPTTAQIKEILDAIDCAPKPVLIHCFHGEDRTGLIVALWRIRHGATIADAYDDMMKRGFHAYFPGVWNAWVRETGWNHRGTERALTAALASEPVCPTQAPAAESLASKTPETIVIQPAAAVTAADVPCTTRPPKRTSTGSAAAAN